MPDYFPDTIPPQMMELERRLNNPQAHIDKLLQKLDKRGHVAPRGIYWARAYDILPTFKGTFAKPPILEDEDGKPPLSEIRQRFMEHLNWARDTFVLLYFISYIDELNDSDFHNSSN